MFIFRTGLPQRLFCIARQGEHSPLFWLMSLQKFVNVFTNSVVCNCILTNKVF